MGGTDDFNDKLVEKIEQLLLGPDETALEHGLYLLDLHYRLPVCGHVRRWSNRNQRGLQSCDLPQVWQNTLLSLLAKIDQQEFERRGQLMGWLVHTACWRAHDLLRTENRHRRGTPIRDDVAWIRWDPPHELAELVSAVEEGCNNMTQLEQTVMMVYLDVPLPLAQVTERVRAILASDSGTDVLGSSGPQSTDDASRFNEQPTCDKPTITVAAVKSALQRGRRKLSDFLQRKGYSRGR